MQVAKAIISGKERIVHLQKVGMVAFAPGVWALVEDLDRSWYDTQLRWVPVDTTPFVWVREFSV